MRKTLLALVAAVAACQGPPDGCAWLQWAGDPAHAGAACTSAQPMLHALADIPYDPFVELEQFDADGDILVHYQVPLVVGDDVYMEFKAGDYTPCVPPTPMTPRMCAPDRWRTQIWTEKRYHWEGGALVRKWTFPSDWKPPPTGGFEPFFQPVIVGPRMYVPGGAGSIYELDRESGALLRHLSIGGDPDTYVSSPLSADPQGNVYYTTLALSHDDPWGTDARGALVRLSALGVLSMVRIPDLTPGAPHADDLCMGTFNRRDNPLPWPPPPHPDGTPVLPESAPCGSQRPAINAAPAVGPSGTLFLVSRAHFNDRYSYLVALDPDLRVKWVKSLRDLLADGCGVLVPDDGDDMDLKFDCRPGAALGVDPATNQMPAARAVEESSSSPVALPDGGVLYGAYTGYNGARGHLLKLDAGGRFVASYDFGWDTTPAIWRHDGSYSIVLKDNHYFGENGAPEGPYLIVQLDRNLRPEWRFTSTNTVSCQRPPDSPPGAPPVCMDDHPNGFEWCINAPVVDRQGTVYVNSEDGNVYAIGQGGIEKQRLFLDMAVGAAYTPLAIDGRGLIYTLNDGRLSVLGR
ncbi:MAG TPA: hypothetical protein VKN99_01770 [Polyangia bacterium]|nr:hypothetical protein [Polyangia bacterium]